jgi:hypothetical protein
MTRLFYFVRARQAQLRRPEVDGYRPMVPHCAAVSSHGGSFCPKKVASEILSEVLSRSQAAAFYQEATLACVRLFFGQPNHRHASLLH